MQSIPSECPTCACQGVRSAVKLYQVNLEEAAVFCENPSCAFPLFSPELCPIVIPHKPTVASSSHPPMIRWGKQSSDSMSVSSIGSCSSWVSNASNASTVSSISSNVATPTPPHSSSSVALTPWPSTRNNSTSSAHQLIASVTKKKNTFDWMSPNSSAVASPAGSLISCTDSEVDLVMKNLSACPTPTLGLTPSPSPLLTEHGPSRTNDDIDTFIVESLLSFDHSKEPVPSSTTSQATTTQLDPSLEQENPPLLTEMAPCAISAPVTSVGIPAPPTPHLEGKSDDMSGVPLEDLPYIIPTVPEQPNGSSPLETSIQSPTPVQHVTKTRKRPPKKTQTASSTDDADDDECEPKRKRTLDSMPVWGNIELPTRRISSKQKRSRSAVVNEAAASDGNHSEVETSSAVKPAPSEKLPAKASRPTVSHSEDSSSSATERSVTRKAPSKRSRTKAPEPVQLPPSAPGPAPAEQVAEKIVPSVAMEVNEEGTTVFTITPVIPPARPAPSLPPAPPVIKPVQPPVAKATSARPRKTPATPKPAATMLSSPEGRPTKRPAKKDAFCIQSLVQKFIATAKSKKPPSA